MPLDLNVTATKKTVLPRLAHFRIRLSVNGKISAEYYLIFYHFLAFLSNKNPLWFYTMSIQHNRGYYKPLIIL